MLSVIIPTLNSAPELPATLQALVPGAVSGLISNVVVADGGSTDATKDIAEDAGCEWVEGPPGRGAQLAAGASRARGNWLLFLHADTVLRDNWIEDIESFVKDTEQRNIEKAAVFRFALATHKRRARMIEWLTWFRGAVFALPYGDQGLLIERSLFDRIGGMSDLPIMEDVEIVRRLGRRRLATLPSRAVTSAARYEQNGYFRRPLHNLTCLSLYLLGAPIETIRKRYG